VADYQWWENMLKTCFFKQQRWRRDGDRAAQREKIKKKTAPLPQSGKKRGKEKKGRQAQMGAPDTRLPPDTFGLAPSALLKLGLAP
jgi:hypothetical protein